MPVIRRGPRWMVAGRIAVVLMLAGLVAYMVVAGLTTASLVAGSLGGVAALAALLAPYLLPPPPVPGGRQLSRPGWVEDSGAATATGGGEAITGVQDISGAGPVQVYRSGDARAEGPGSAAITGIQRRPGPDQ